MLTPQLLACTVRFERDLVARIGQQPLTFGNRRAAKFNESAR